MSRSKVAGFTLAVAKASLVKEPAGLSHCYFVFVFVIIAQSPQLPLILPHLTCKFALNYPT